jgi:hypothetical protein
MKRRNFPAITRYDRSGEPPNAIAGKKNNAGKPSIIRQPRFSADVEYQLEPFKPNGIRDYSTLILCGGRRTGKSFCMRDIIYHFKQKIYDCYVFTGTRDEEHPWENYTPEKYVTYVQSEFPNDDLQSKLDTQLIRKQIAEKHGVECPPTMMVFEDLEFLIKPMWKHQSIRQIFLNGRWSKVFAVAAVQYLNKIELSVRSMMDYAIFMMENNCSVRERIWKQFCGILPSMRDFEAVFMRCTEDHKCLVVDCRSTSYKINEILYWYKASDRGPFRLGMPEVWDENVDIKNRQLSEDMSMGSDGAPPSVAAAIMRNQKDKWVSTKRCRGSSTGSIGVQLRDVIRK